MTGLNLYSPFPSTVKTESSTLRSDIFLRSPFSNMTVLDPVKQPPAFDGCVASVKNANRYDDSIQHVLNENILYIYIYIWGSTNFT